MGSSKKRPRDICDLLWDSDSEPGDGPGVPTIVAEPGVPTNVAEPNSEPGDGPGVPTSVGGPDVLDLLLASDSDSEPRPTQVADLASSHVSASAWEPLTLAVASDPASSHVSVSAWEPLASDPASSHVNVSYLETLALDPASSHVKVSALESLALDPASSHVNVSAWAPLASDPASSHDYVLAWEPLASDPASQSTQVNVSAWDAWAPTLVVPDLAFSHGHGNVSAWEPTLVVADPASSLAMPYIEPLHASQIDLDDDSLLLGLLMAPVRLYNLYRQSSPKGLGFKGVSFPWVVLGFWGSGKVGKEGQGGKEGRNNLDGRLVSYYEYEARGRKDQECNKGGVEGRDVRVVILIARSYCPTLPFILSFLPNIHLSSSAPPYFFGSPSSDGPILLLCPSSRHRMGDSNE